MKVQQVKKPVGPGPHENNKYNRRRDMHPEKYLNLLGLMEWFGLKGENYDPE